MTFSSGPIAKDPPGGFVPLIPLNRLTTFQPGVTYNGGIPNRTTISTTLNPIGGNASVTLNSGSPASISWNNHGRSAGDGFILQFTPNLQAATGVSSNSLYFVLASGLTANSFQFATSPGGTAVNATASATVGILIDDTSQINAAITACPANQVVLLGAGTFTITGNAISIQKSNITLRGSGTPPSGSGIVSGSQGPATASGTYTTLWKGDSIWTNASNPFGLLYVGGADFTNSGTSINLMTDAVQGAFSCQVASAAGLTVGQLVLVDHNTDNDPSVFWGNENQAAGAAFIGSVSGTSLTISSFNTTVSNGSVAVNQHVFYANGLVGQIASGSGNNWTLQSAGPTITNQYMEAGNGTRRFFCRQDRSLCQMMKIAGVAGNTVTFETPFHVTHPVALAAQLVTVTSAETTRVGIENLYLYAGTGGDGNGNLAMSYCSYSWVKNVESHYANGTGLGLYTCYRCEIRDSYMHESPSPNPGGGGYLCGLNVATSECLVENNIMWCGNKVIVMRGTGGGNVIAYNYMEDAFGAGFPMSQEAGINAAHFTTSHMELLEGNYSHEFKADAFWGNSIYITVFRNWLSNLRAAANVHTNFACGQSVTNAASAAGTNTLSFATGGVTAGMSVGTSFKVSNLTTPSSIPAGTTITASSATSVTLSNNIASPGVGNGDNILVTFDGTLNNYLFYDGNVTTYPYIDSWSRVACDIQAHSYYNNIAANVLGYNGQVGKGFGSFFQVNLKYEDLGTAFGVTGADMDTYRIGIQQDPTQTFWIANQDATILRQGNWDWMTGSQRWHGIGGAVGTGRIASVPVSYYLNKTPAFWGATPWPWVDPSTGTTYTLPAKARFETMTGTKTPIPPGNQ